MDFLIETPGFWSAVHTALENHPDIAAEIRRNVEEQERRAALSHERRQARTAEERTNANAKPDVGVRGRSPHPQTFVPTFNSSVRDVDTDQTEFDNQRERSTRRSRDHHIDEADEGEFIAPPPADDMGQEERIGESLENEFNNDEQQAPPDLYEILGDNWENLRRVSGNGVQRLDNLLEELEIDALWSARDVTISFCELTRVLMRLFVGPYATDEENMIVRMLNLGVERASKYHGFGDHYSGSRETATEPFYVTYRRRGLVLRDFAAFRYMLEVTENAGRIGRKQKNDLIMLYTTLTTPEVRLHRRGDADDRGEMLAFRDHVSGYTITTPLIMAKPMTIEMHLDSVFGNVATNARILDRSLKAALNNRNRKVNGLSTAQEVGQLMDNAHLLDLHTGDGSGSPPGPQILLRPYKIEKERVAIRHMLETSVIVSMMAEEYRVFVAGAPPSRSGGGKNATGASGSKRSSNEQHQRTTFTMFRRPIFFTMKPVAPATSTNTTATATVTNE